MHREHVRLVKIKIDMSEKVLPPEIEGKEPELASLGECTSL
jgi:hypothetical protein